MYDTKWVSQRNRWDLLKPLWRKTILKEQRAEAEQYKFCTFLQSSLIPKRLRYKLDKELFIRNTKKSYKTGNIKPFFTPRNDLVVRILMRMYMLIFYTLHYVHLQNVYKPLYGARDFIADQIYDISIFNYFNNNYFNKYYFNNKHLQYIVKGYYLDSDNFNTYINYYNLYLFLNLDIFKVLLNFEYYKYEDDAIFYSDPKKKNYKNKKKVLMHTDFYDYIWRKNRVRHINKYTWKLPHYNKPWNIIDKSEDDIMHMQKQKHKKDLKAHLLWQHNIFFCFIIYELSLNIHKKVLFSYFNYDFFSRVLIFQKKEEKKKIIKYPYFLTSTYYTYNLELLNIKKQINPVNKKVLYTNYKNLQFSLNDQFDCRKHILDIKYYGVRMPFLFFLLHTWYSIHYRRYRYNLYIRGDLFFQEHFSKVKLFLWSNSAARSNQKGITSGKNVWKLTQYRYHKLFTLYHLKTYLEVAWFNNWFIFYSAYHSKLKRYTIIESNQRETSFAFLLNTNYILKLLNIVNHTNEFFQFFFFNYSTKYHYMYELNHSYDLLMRYPVTKFDKTFKFGSFGYFKYKKMVHNVFILPTDRLKLAKYIEKKMINEHMLSLYSTLNFKNFYFLKDLFNFNDKCEFIQYFKINHFYDKILSLIFLLIDPFFFKYYWRRCFPRRWHKIRYIQYYIMSVIIMQKFLFDHNNIRQQKKKIIYLNVPKYNFLMNFLNWRIDTSNFKNININNSYRDEEVSNRLMIQMINKNRYSEFLQQINALLFNAQVLKFYKSYYHIYLITFKNYYFDLLSNNIEYNLIFFFNNKSKYFKLLNNTPSILKKKIYYNFIYRHFMYSILLESHFYDDWFIDKKKRIYWIYKSFVAQEGPRFYKNKTDIL